MNLICLDFETFYSNDFTLRKLTTESYIRDPRFEALLIGWATPDGRSGYVEQAHLSAFLADVVPDAGVVMHHAHFDGLILSHHFGVKPAFIFDTLSMGRQLHGTSIGLSLAKLAEHYNLSPKTVPYDLFIGRRWAELDAETRRLLGEGAAHDCALTMEIFRQMLPQFPKEELLIIDITTRMFTEPCLVGDAALFAELRDEEFLKKNELLYALDVGEKDLASADKFCALLEREGVDIEYKAGKNGDIPAIAATDQFMRDMAAGVYGETVAFLAEARLTVKSTIAETRCGRLHEMSRRGPLPVYLNYCLSGDTQIIVANPNGWFYKNLDALGMDERVWDGQEFVNHGGLVCRGRREVIEWCGVVATPDHVSWDESGARTSVGAAKERGVELMGAALPRDQDWQLAYQLPASATSAHQGVVPLPLWRRDARSDSQFGFGRDASLSPMCAAAGSNKANKQESGEPLEQHEPALHLSWAQALVSVRGTRDTESVPYTEGLHSLCIEGASAPDVQGRGDRQDRQQRALRTGEFTAGVAPGAVQEHREISGGTPVFDIYMCGSRNRFAANGRIVSNCGAHTTRWSGGDKSNMQNMPRGSRMRTGVKAPDGFLLCPTDQEQGECRVVNWLAGQWDVVQRFANGEDVYLPMASSFYGRPITKADKKERQVGKTLELMGGFGGGAAKIGATLKIAGVILTPEEQERAKNTYRGDHPRVVAYWAEARELLPRLANKERFTWGPFEGRDGKIILPNGGWIDYSSLSWEEDEKTGEHEWRLRSRRGWTKAYGAKLVENVVQALSRVITSQAMIKVRNAGYHIVMSSHDDFVPLVPIDGHEEEARLFFEACMSETPAWAPGLPLAASGKLGATYD